MIIFNEELIYKFELSKEIFTAKDNQGVSPGNGISHESKLRLYYFYFGLTFLGIGSMLYKFKCPPLIRENVSESEYVRNDNSLMTIKRTKSIIGYLSEKINQRYFEELKDIEMNINEIKNSHGSIPPVAREKYVIDLMLMQWQFENWSKPMSRWSILIFYVLGFLILAFPAIQTFIIVFQAAINIT